MRRFKQAGLPGFGYTQPKTKEIRPAKFSVSSKIFHHVILYHRVQASGLHSAMSNCL